MSWAESAARSRPGPTRLRLEDGLMLGALVLLPWLWGGVEMGSCRVASAMVVLAAAVCATRSGLRALFPRGAAGIWVPAAVLAAWGALQCVPLPPGVIAALSPKAAAVQRSSFGPAGADAATWLRQLEKEARDRVPEAPEAFPAASPARPASGASPAPSWWTISLVPSVTEERTYWYVALLLGFTLVARRAALRDVGATYETVLFGGFTALALVTLAQRLTAPATLLWIRPAPEATRPFGPYVNPDHFAAAMELGVPWMVGFAVDRWSHSRLRGRLDGKAALAIVGAAAGFLGAILAASRAATALMLASVAIVSIVAARGRQARWVRLVVVGTAALVVLAGLAAGFLGERIADFLSLKTGFFGGADRAIAWRSAVPMARDYWLTGSGIGAFRAVFPPYLPTGESGTWAQAHSDWLEIALGGGVIALGLTIAILVGYAAQAGRSIRSALKDRRGGAVMGATLGVASLTLHSLVDFSLQIPGNALLFVAIAAWAAGEPRRSEETP